MRSDILRGKACRSREQQIVLETIDMVLDVINSNLSEALKMIMIIREDPENEYTNVYIKTNAGKPIACITVPYHR